MIQAAMTIRNRNKRSAYFLAAGLVLMAAGVALGSVASFMIGLTVAAVVVRYRASPWEYLCFVAVLIALPVWGFCTGSHPWWPSSPLVGAIPFMLSYVFDYLGERRQKRAPTAEATVPGGASDGGTLAEPIAAPNVGLATQAGSSEVREGPPSVS